MSGSRGIQIFGSVCLLAFGMWCAGCTATHSVSDGAPKEESPAPPSFDGMVLTTIQRNVGNVKAEMSPDDVVTILGLRALGTLERTPREDGVDYDFAGQRSMLIVNTSEEDNTLDDRFPMGGIAYAPAGVGSSDLLRTSRFISEIILQKSDGTRASFFPAKAP
ncbi:MAG: hypothetical protein HON53_00615 [Planctomycetaceae bacterium]|jgi:hypothetical protein|nr:hypothetical protein [Planctomycetaceae bacterium]MBT6157092.1 hypothetical protein [Planctomycetaceae bacterium]MBT6484342.1 hypothetical protein [Planctomycetaceae bacterium]MBT6498075.1 hypothetical protein [Planctomycetaceae bacterium]